jgi:hypothetical protein
MVVSKINPITAHKHFRMASLLAKRLEGISTHFSRIGHARREAGERMRHRVCLGRAGATCLRTAGAVLWVMRIVARIGCLDAASGTGK